MNRNDYIKYIQQEIESKVHYDEYVHAFEEYKVYLEKRLEQSPNDVNLSCQLATVVYELRQGSDISIKILEE